MEPLLAPVMQTCEAAFPDRIRTVLRDSLPADWIVWPSPAAVEHTLALIGPEALAGVRVLVPGQGTARAARSAGLDNLLVPESGFTSEAMLDLEALQEVEGLRFLLCTSAGGRRMLEHTLRSRGAHVTRIPVYRRLSLPIGDRMVQHILAARRLVVLASSASILTALHSALPADAWERVRRAPWIVPSRRVRGMALEVGIERIQVVAGVSDDAVLQACEALLEH